MKLIKGILLILGAVAVGMMCDHYGIQHPTELLKGI